MTTPQKIHKNLITTLLNPTPARDKTPFSDITMNDLNNSVKTTKMFNNLEGWTAETRQLKQLIAVKKIPPSL